ncbi:hypothetical protein [Nonomuraea africana]|uniref:hypothetical protein n=1 Tax=Nonomuraea africana TaxID=46171 RepID=UPI003401F90E
MSDIPCQWLPGLRAKEGGPAPAASPATLNFARETLGEGPTGWAVETAGWMTQEVIRQVPAYGGGRTPFETLRRSVEATVLAALTGLFRDTRPSPDLVPVEAVEGNAELVRRGVPLDVVLRGVRIGHACLHQRLMDAIDAEPEPVRLAESHRVSELLFSYADAHASRMAEEYIAERDRWQASTEAARRRIVDDILAGRRIDQEAASRTLGYEVARHHLAFVVAADELDTPAEELRRFAAEVGRAVGGQGVLTVQAGPSEGEHAGVAGGMVVRDVRTEPAASDVAELLDLAVARPSCCGHGAPGSTAGRAAGHSLNDPDPGSGARQLASGLVGAGGISRRAATGGARWPRPPQPPPPRPAPPAGRGGVRVDRTGCPPNRAAAARATDGRAQRG